jgi:hypothetical protein
MFGVVVERVGCTGRRGERRLGAADGAFEEVAEGGEAAACEWDMLGGGWREGRYGPAVRQVCVQQGVGVYESAADDLVVAAGNTTKRTQLPAAASTMTPRVVA